MAEQSEEKFSFILYQKGDVPKFFKLGRGTFQFYFYFIPALTLILFASTFTLLFYIKQLSLPVLEAKLTDQLDELKQEKSELIGQNEQLQIKVKSLEQRLAAVAEQPAPKPEVPVVVQPDPAANQPVKPAEPVIAQNASPLSLFATGAGQTQIPAKPSLSIENIKFDNSEGHSKVSFILMNVTKGEEQKLSGYIFMVLRLGNEMHIYPAKAKLGSGRLPINKGEYFAIMRARPVEAEFPAFVPGPNNSLNVYIFSLQGDLMLQQTLTAPKGL